MASLVCWSRWEKCLHLSKSQACRILQLVASMSLNEVSTMLGANGTTMLGANGTA